MLLSLTGMADYILIYEKKLTKQYINIWNMGNNEIDNRRKDSKKPMDLTSDESMLVQAHRPDL